MEANHNYRLSNKTIEKAQLRFLNYFLGGIESQHLSDMWCKKSEKSGTEFIVKFIADMSTKGVSITAEETIETTMRQFKCSRPASRATATSTSPITSTSRL